MSLSRLHLRTRLDIFNVFLTISSIRSNPSFVLTSVFPHISIGDFQLLSPRLRQCTLVPRSHLLLIPLGSFFLLVPISALCRSDAIHLSQCRLLCPCVPSADVCVTVLDISVISPFSLSAVFPLQLFNTYVESMLSIHRVRSRLSSFTFSPTVHSLSPLLASCGEPSIMRYVPRFHLLVFSSSSSVFAFLA